MQLFGKPVIFNPELDEEFKKADIKFGQPVKLAKLEVQPAMIGKRKGLKMRIVKQEK